MESRLTFKTKSDFRKALDTAKLVKFDVVIDGGILVISLVARRVNSKFFKLSCDRMESTHSVDALTDLIVDHINDRYVKEIFIDDLTIRFIEVE